MGKLEELGLFEYGLTAEERFRRSLPLGLPNYVNDYSPRLLTSEKAEIAGHKASVEMTEIGAKEANTDRLMQVAGAVALGTNRAWRAKIVHKKAGFFGLYIDEQWEMTIEPD